MATPVSQIPRRGATSQNTDVNDLFIYRDYLWDGLCKRSADW